VQPLIPSEWGGPRASTDALKKRKIFWPPGKTPETQTMGISASSIYKSHNSTCLKPSNIQWI
jgi:hypothetical protein